MRFAITSLFLFLLSQIVYAQKGIDSLVAAERGFAAYSVSHSAKEAFLQFLDSNGIVFDNGTPVNGLTSWNSRQKNEAVLNWYPQLAETSGSDDFGYTTGPWTYQPSASDSVIVRGQYITVWHITKEGQWKFLVDLGVSNTPADNKTTLFRTERAPHKPQKDAENAMRKAEMDLINGEGSIIERYRKYLSTNVILNRNGRAPVKFPVSGWDIILKEPPKIKYTIAGSGMASSGDLGYIYGVTVINGKTDNYLRIWRNEQEGWKIAVEVLRY